MASSSPVISLLVLFLPFFIFLLLPFLLHALSSLAVASWYAEIIIFKEINCYDHSAEVLKRLCAKYFNCAQPFIPSARMLKKRRTDNAQSAHVMSARARAHGARTCSVCAVYFACTHNVRPADIKSGF